MTAILIIAGTIVAALGALMLHDALRRPGDQRDPEQPHNPRTRADYEAEVAAPVAAADEVAAAEHVAFLEEIGSGEFPSLAFDADPLGAPIPEGHRVEDAGFFQDVTADMFAAFAWRPTPAARVALSSVEVLEPAPLELETFTSSWTRADIERMVAEAKAAAS